MARSRSFNLHSDWLPVPTDLALNQWGIVESRTTGFLRLCFFYSSAGCGPQ